MNINRSSFSYEEMLRRMKIFLLNNALEAGTSTIFQDFRELQVHVGQAMAMADYALRDRQKKLYEFDENVLSMMLSFSGKGEKLISTKSVICKICITMTWSIIRSW